MESKIKDKKAEIHLSDINEYLADRFLEYSSPFELELRNLTTDGFIEIKESKSSKEIEKDGLDFELSTCECLGLNNLEISEFLEKPVYTGSAYELFDFYFSKFYSLRCLVDFIEGAWVIKVLDYN